MNITQTSVNSFIIYLGDNIDIDTGIKVQDAYAKIKSKYIPDFKNELILRISPSCQFEDFSKEDIEIFLSSVYTVTSQSNRMGFRLNGKNLKNAKKGVIK